MDGPRSARSAAPTTMKVPILSIPCFLTFWSLIEPNPWIEQAVHEIRQHVHRDVRDRDEEDAALDHRVVAKTDRLDEEPAHTGPGEDRFGNDRAGQHRPKLQAEDSDDRDEAVAKRMADDRTKRRNAPRAGSE